MRLKMIGVIVATTLALAATASVTVKKGTEVKLKFAQALSSRTVKAGDTVRLTVAEPLMVDGQTVLKEGASVTGVVEKVTKRSRYGINAQIRMVLNPVRTAMGKSLTLEPRGKGNVVGGKTGEAAAATVGGAAILGPVGLIGGYFITGKSVNVKVGDPLVTQVAKTVVVG